MTIDATTVLSIYSVVLTVLIGIIGFFLVRTFKELDNKASKNDLETANRELDKKASKSDLSNATKDIEVNTADIRKIKDNYLTKEDYFREQAKVDKKLDSIMDILIKLSKEG